MHYLHHPESAFDHQENIFLDHATGPYSVCRSHLTFRKIKSEPSEPKPKVLFNSRPAAIQCSEKTCEFKIRHFESRCAKRDNPVQTGSSLSQLFSIQLCGKFHASSQICYIISRYDKSDHSRFPLYDTRHQKACKSCLPQT